jgi:aminopeptidase N
MNVRTILIRTLVFTTVLLSSLRLHAQEKVFTRQDTLRGSITPERSWWDLKYYHLDIAVKPSDSTIKGENIVYYKVIKPDTLMQIDLQQPLVLTKAVSQGKSLKYTREGNVYWIEMDVPQETGMTYSIELSYEGRPVIAVHPPWEGGITWDYDKDNLPFIASSCQGAGASIWWPCKDHMYDEPDSMLISVNVPGNLMDISNGKLRKIETQPDGTKTFHWFV